MSRGPLKLTIAVILVLAHSTTWAQEALLTKSPVQPGQGGLNWRQQFLAMRYGADPQGMFNRVDEFTSVTMLAYGLTGELALEGRLPLSFRDFSGGHHTPSDQLGMDEASMTLKWRVWRDDYGPTNTARASLFGGFYTPMLIDGDLEGGWNPVIGGLFMQVHDRHGWNIAGMYELTTSATEMVIHPGNSLADLARLDLAYLYRLQPAEYSAETTHSLYAVLELNCFYETNSDREIRLAPGILYEAADIALEAGIQFPLYDRLRYRPDREWSAVVGFRLLF